MNGLKEVEAIIKSEAVLIANKSLNEVKQELLERFLFRIRAYKKGMGSKYIVMNAPNSSIPKICSILPGMKSPSILPLAEEGWSSVHSVVQEDQFWDVIDALKDVNAQGILVMNIEKMIL